MKNRMLRPLALLLAALLALPLAGCGTLSSPLDKLASLTPPPAAAPSAVPSPAATPAPVQEDAPDASEQLRALDLAMFTDSVSTDPMTLKLSLKDPSVYGIEMPEASWGDISEADTAEAVEQWEEWQTMLLAIDRSALTKQEQLTYDTIAQELEFALRSADGFWYEEPLSPMNGLHTNLPFNFILYEIDTRQDAENYLALLEDSARYMAEEILAFEQGKAERGTFMNDTSLDLVLEQILDFTDAGDSCFLYATFRDQIAPLQLTAEEEEAYCARNDAAVENLLAAYQTLYEGLSLLRGTKPEGGALWEYGEEGLAYFERSLEYAGCTRITPEEAAAVLEQEIESDYTELFYTVMQDESVLEDYGSVMLTVGSSLENLNLLEELYPLAYPPLKEHSVRFIDVPEELEDQFSPAAYLVPPIDDASENTIIINEKSMAEADNLLDTIAHEGYPGHMYHYIYIRDRVEETGLYRQTMGLTAYYESWSQYAENFFDENNTAFSNHLCKVMTIDGRIANVLLPALLSIRIHYDGWTAADCGEYCAVYMGEENGKVLGGVIYEYALHDPFYYIEYALGYSILQQELDEAKAILGDRFDIAAFNKAFLDIGPTYFNLIDPLLEDWVYSCFDIA